MSLRVKQDVNSVMSSVTYLLDSQTLVDCGDWHEVFTNIRNVLLTHAHYDHIYGLNRLLEDNAKLRIFTNEVGGRMLLSDKANLSRYHESPFVLNSANSITIISDGDEVDLPNGLTAKAIFTPGHNPSCITWLIGDALITGDAFIPGLKTVTNLPGGNKSQAAESEAMIASLAEGRTIYPGHRIKCDFRQKIR